jgi:hypothetical protein
MCLSTQFVSRGAPNEMTSPSVSLLGWSMPMTSLSHPLDPLLPLDAVAAPSGKVLRQGLYFP